jgi:16S rRNA (cytidine1402-2'-O)-methyltransferase
MSSSGRDGGTLLVVGTPIGNLEDITVRALEVLRSVSVIAAEDTRVTARLLGRYKISTPCVSFREQNARRAVPDLIARLKDGNDVALVSDAGTPSISDPGEQLVDAASRVGITVSPVPGPSALASAMSVAALRGDGVRFVGFLPRSTRKREDRLLAIAVDPSISVLYESPSRLGRTLKDLARACPDRSAVVLREMTKIHEEIARGSLEDLADRFSDRVKGEITVVVAGNEQTMEEISTVRLTQLVVAQVNAGGSAKDVAVNLSRALGVPKKRIYEIAVEAIANRIQVQ